MAKRLKNIKKGSMYVKRSFEHLLKKKERYIKAKLTMLTCNSSTPKKAASASLQSLDEASLTPTPTSPSATAVSSSKLSSKHRY